MKFKKELFIMTDFIMKFYDFIVSIVEAIQAMVGQIREKNDEK